MTLASVLVIHAASVIKPGERTPRNHNFLLLLNIYLFSLRLHAEHIDGGIWCCWARISSPLTMAQLTSHEIVTTYKTLQFRIGSVRERSSSSRTRGSPQTRDVYSLAAPLRDAAAQSLQTREEGLGNARRADHSTEPDLEGLVYRR